MPTAITSKSEMYRRLNSGQLGHTIPSAETWEQLERMTAGGGRFAIRSKTVNRGTVFDLSAAEVRERVATLTPDSWNVSPMLNDAHRICYGHLIDAVGGWHLHYSDTPKPCKLMPSVDGCEEKWKDGLAARLYLRSIMDDTGWETLLRLLDDYPDHVIEFSVMTDAVHAFGPTRVIFWEVRSTCGAYERFTWR